MKGNKLCLNVEVKQPAKFALFSKGFSTLIYDECFVIGFRASAPPSCSTAACDVTGLVRSVGQLSNIGICLFFKTHTFYLNTSIFWFSP